MTISRKNNEWVINNCAHTKLERYGALWEITIPNVYTKTTRDTVKYFKTLLEVKEFLSNYNEEAQIIGDYYIAKMYGNYHL